MSKNKESEWITISFPRKLYKQVEKSVEREESSFRNSSEYIRAATREKLERDKKEGFSLTVD
jgi:Arc/MetJ-type ribon-helix-helix transcriptional regulator